MLEAVFAESSFNVVIWILLVLTVAGILTVVIMKILKKHEQPRIIIAIITMCIAMLLFGVLVYKVSISLTVNTFISGAEAQTSQISQTIPENSQ